MWLTFFILKIDGDGLVTFLFGGILIFFIWVFFTPSRNTSKERRLKMIDDLSEKEFIEFIVENNGNLSHWTYNSNKNPDVFYTTKYEIHTDILDDNSFIKVVKIFRRYDKKLIYKGHFGLS